MQGYVKNKDRLSDRILFAMELSLKQEDLEVSEILSRALDLAMTRNTGGGEFVERRDYAREIERALEDLQALRKKR